MVTTDGICWPTIQKNTMLLIRFGVRHWISGMINPLREDFYASVNISRWVSSNSLAFCWSCTYLEKEIEKIEIPSFWWSTRNWLKSWKRLTLRWNVTNKQSSSKYRKLNLVWECVMATLFSIWISWSNVSKLQSYQPLIHQCSAWRLFP